MEEYYECGKGWWPLIKEAKEIVDKWNKENPDKEPIVFHQIKEKYGCYDKDTQVLTENGWKYFKDVSFEDKIATLGKNNILEYQKPIDIICEPYKGKMYKLVNRGIDLLVTPNHQLYLSKGSYFYHKKSNYKREYLFEFCTPNKYFDKDRRFQKGAAIWEGKEQKEFKLEDLKLPRELKKGSGKYRIYTIKFPTCAMDSFLKFLGFYIAEGCCDPEKGEINIAYNALNEENLVCNILNGLNFNYYDYSKETRGLKKLYNKNLAIWLYENCKHRAWNKRVPVFIKTLSPRQIKIFLEYLYIGDGHKTKTSNILTTTSKGLAEDVEELLLKVGNAFRTNSRFRNKKENSNNRIQSKRICYEINWLSLSYIELEMSKQRKSKSFIETWIDYDDFVYCVTVPNHIIYVKRNGKGCWCGNSLRLYLSAAPKEIWDKMDALEEKSYTICEHCGSTQNVDTREIRGWIYTVCDKCAKELETKNWSELNNG